MINKRLLTALLAVTTVTTSVAVNVQASYAQAAAAERAAAARGSRALRQWVGEFGENFGKPALKGAGGAVGTGSIYCVSNPEDCQRKRDEAIRYYRGHRTPKTQGRASNG